MRRFAIPLILAVLFGVPALAVAQGGGEEGMRPPPYKSPMQAECTAELAKDPAWKAKLERQFEAEFQQRWATRFANDRRHVIMAYAALWVLTAAFIAFVWLRQQRLVGEIGRLEGELARAIAEEEKAGGGGRAAAGEGASKADEGEGEED